MADAVIEASKPMIEMLFSLRMATMVFEKRLPIRRPTPYDTDVREGSIRSSVAATLRQKNSRTPCL